MEKMEYREPPKDRSITPAKHASFANKSAKYTLQEARTFHDHTINDRTLTCPDQIPEYIFKKLMIVDYRVREFKFKPLTSDENKVRSSYNSDSSEDESSDEDVPSEDEVNPMDALLRIFRCSDNSLRRYFAVKLSECQLSVPFLLPDPAAPSQNITMLLSALENITKCWNSGSGPINAFVTEHPFPVVSFIRIGENTLSKSSLINEIMSDGSMVKKFFFHKDMEGGYVKRKDVDGLVELSWYFPEKSTNKIVPHEICFANLRGDASNFKKQLNVLLKISSVLCIIPPSKPSDVLVTDILNTATNSVPKVILIFNENKYMEDEGLKAKYGGKLFSLTRKSTSSHSRFIQRTRDNIQKNIRELGEVKAIPLKELASFALEYGVHLDQSRSRLEKSVNTWLEMGLKEAKDLMKLQKHIPVFAKLERKRNHSKLQISDWSKINHTEGDALDVCKDFQAEKEAQRASLIQLDKRVLTLLNFIAMLDESERNNALNELKNKLDKMSLRFMTNESCQKWVEKSLENQYDFNHLEQEISKYSFGLEHIVRELAQLYQIEECKYDYAGAAADMLLSGQPLELLDGDSFYIPLEWFDAVYTKLENKTNNARIFVISVLGIQSSGKSTMLNTMFGLEFPVSAGRCTRGAFANLIPVSDSLKTASKSDFILIIDTEGLNGSSDPQLRDHDIQLATFVIGVASLTIVNIFGENQNDMKEFLQIAVRSLIKTNFLKERKACKIVHQNVIAIGAEKKLTHVRFQLKQDLDDMTKLAAVQGNCKENFQNFNDVISFDENKDVFYIPSLYLGNPPMAPVNPEYGRAIQRIKQSIVTLMCSAEILKYSLFQFRERICNLWRVVVNESSNKDYSAEIFHLSSAPLDLSAKPLLSDSKKVPKAQQLALSDEEPHSLLNSKTEINKPKQEDQSFMSPNLKLPRASNTNEATCTPEKHAWHGNIAQAILWNNPNLKLIPKFTLQQVRTLDNYEIFDSELASSNEIPDYILKALMRNDYNALQFNLKNCMIPALSNNSNDFEDSEDKVDEGINPMDAFLAIFHCSDDPVRRYLALKLSACQLSVPFLLPDPDPRAPSENATILLSALQNITKCWKISSDEKNVKHVFATEHRFPVVSFIRIGEITMSKSSLINHIMSGGGSYHNFFFTKEMKGGHNERKIVDGLVELCWYLPGGSEERILKNEICFANLRGDAKHFKKQRLVLANISSVLCLLLSEKIPDKTTQKILEEETKKKAKIILIFEKKLQSDAKKYFTALTSKYIGKFWVVIKAKDRNDASFLRRIKENIQKHIHQVEALPLVELASCVSEYDIQLDVDQSPKSTFQKNVDSWLKEEITEAKNLLKLQAHVPALADLQRKTPSDTRYENEIRDHIMRELAQLYQIEESEYDYAGAAADMLLSGQPLEIMDGDSFYIPLEWFKAVFTKLELKIKNVKLFVISVLGIQSSGKSTMLNTMFGLDLPVSAGRCTRGAFASLIPVSDSLKNASNFDYVLIIDTKGLSGSADTSKRKKDNELATFGIGVADLIIVNIFGEIHEQVKGFLEIAVHALLKMKLVKEKKFFKIVHQNVSSVNAREKLSCERRKLKEDLDEMTKSAAIHENCEKEILELNDVISFDENKDVFYMPTLYHGNPPMAPVNPEYGKAIREVKKNIITLMGSNETKKIGLSYFRKRVSSLWETIQKENFLFSFRNEIEVRARMSLDQKYFEVSIGLMVAGMNELQIKVELALKSCSTRVEREKKWEMCQQSIDDKAEEIREEMEQAVKEFIQSNEDKETLEQWSEVIMKKIGNQKTTRVLELKEKCLSTFNQLQDLQGIEENKQKFQEVILEEARKFIASVQGTEKAKKLMEVFEEKWQQWIKDIPECREKKIDVNKEMFIVLCDTEKSQSEEMRKKLMEKDNQISNFKGSEISINVHDLSFDKHIIDNFAGSNYKNQIVLNASGIMKFAVEKAIEFAESKSKSGVRCTLDDLKQMYHIVVTTIDKRIERHSFRFRDSLKRSILLYTFAQTYEKFEKMEDRDILERDIRTRLEIDLRPKLKKYFKNAYEKNGKMLFSANLFVEILKKHIESAINGKMGTVVGQIMLKKNSFRSKGAFHATVLIKLGEEGDFDSYIPYLANPVGFLKNELDKSIKNFCLNDEKNMLLKECLKHKIEDIENEVSSAIETANRDTEKESKNITFWILRFVEECPTLGITKETFHVAAIEDLEDLKGFEENVKDQVESFFNDLKKCELNRKAIEKYNPSPLKFLFDTMFACQCTCPFCEALCDKEIDHDTHSTPFHRPRGVIGYKHEKTKILSHHICTKRVASRKTFNNADTNWEDHKYKEYKQVNPYYKSWDIPAVKNESSKYWQWFMATFPKELAKYHETKKPDVPRTWKRRKFREVKDELRQKYDLIGEDQ